MPVECMLEANFFACSDGKTFFFEQLHFWGQITMLGHFGKKIEPRRFGIVPRKDEKQLLMWLLEGNPSSSVKNRRLNINLGHKWGSEYHTCNICIASIV